MKNISLSIGIPAHNEEANIGFLIKNVLRQRQDGFFILEILIISDGSSDRTVEKIKEVRDTRIKVIEKAERKGKSLRCNELFRLFKGEALLMLDADINLEDPLLISSILRTYNIEQSGLIAVMGCPLPHRHLFEQIMNYGVYIQQLLIQRWNGGNNYLAFRGFFFLLSRGAAQSLNIKILTNNDAYIYFFLKSKGFKPRSYSSHSGFFRSPSNFKDYLNQSSRFQHSKEEMELQFPDIDKEYSIPMDAIVYSLIISFIKQPLLFTAYCGVFLMSRIFKKTRLRTAAWPLALSTKQTL